MQNKVTTVSRCEDILGQPLRMGDRVIFCVFKEKGVKKATIYGLTRSSISDCRWNLVLRVDPGQFSPDFVVRSVGFLGDHVVKAINNEEEN